MEGNGREGVLPPLSPAQHTARPAGRTTYSRPLCIYLERGYGADGQGQTAAAAEGERRTEGKKVGGEGEGGGGLSARRY